MPKYTVPTLAQVKALKVQYPDTLLAFRCGDFYEFFGDDADKAASALELTRTRRQFGDEMVTMAGIPYHAIDRYLPRLVRQGYVVALIEKADPSYDQRSARRVILDDKGAVLYTFE